MARPVGSLLTGLVVAAICATILTTTGQTVQAEQAVLGRIDDAGTRGITITDTEGTALIAPAAVDRIASIDGVEWAVGIGYATDVRNAAIGNGGSPAPVRVLYGQRPSVIVLNGREPVPGEALAGVGAASTLGMTLPLGGVDMGDSQLAVVGGFAAGEPLSFLNTGLLAAPFADDAGPVRSIHILTSDPSRVSTVAETAILLVGSQDPSVVSVSTSETLADIRAAVEGELGQYGRSLVLLVLGAGLVLVALTVYGSVTLQRQDFGRRRALGATRTAIVWLVTGQCLLIAFVGALVGIVAGSLASFMRTGAPPDSRFALATGLLAMLATLLAAMIPAVVAATRDPVRVLRIP